MMDINSLLIQDGGRIAIKENISRLFGQVSLTKPNEFLLYGSDIRAYIAGIVDGEGCISFGHLRGGRFIRVHVTNTNIELLEWLKSLFGGDINKLNIPQSGWKQGYSWRISWSRAIDFLEAIDPWLRVKKNQAEIAFAWDAIRPGKGGGKQDQSACDLLVAELHWCNRKGPSQGHGPINDLLKEIGYAAD